MTATSARSPPDSSDSRLTFLPGGRASTSMPVVSMFCGSVRTSLPSPPGNSRLKTSSNSAATSYQASVKTCSHLRVDVVDDVEEVLTGLAEVVELLGEELVALLQGRELLQRERVHLAEHRHRPLGGAQALGLRLTVIRDRLGFGRLVIDLVGFLQDRRHELVGPVLGDEGVDLEPELLQRPCLQRLDPQPQLGAGHLVLVHGVGEPVELGAEVAQAGADVAQRLLAPGAGGLDVGSSSGRLLDGRLEARQHDVADRDDRLGGLRLADLPLPALAGADAFLTLGLRRLQQRRDLPLEGSRPLLVRAQRQPRLGLGSPGVRRLLGETLENGGVGFFLGRCLGALETLLELGEARQVAFAGLLGSG